MDRHEAARAARLELAEVVRRLKDECGIERQKVAAMLGLAAPMLSRVTAANVRDRPTLAPPEDWKRTLRAELSKLGSVVKGIAAELA